MPEWAEWQRYFAEYLRYTPYIMRRILAAWDGSDKDPTEDKKNTWMTVPTLSPQEFDGGYVASRPAA